MPPAPLIGKKTHYTYYSMVHKMSYCRRMYIRVNLIHLMLPLSLNFNTKSAETYIWHCS